jgi:hypothetical protein
VTENESGGDVVMVEEVKEEIGEVGQRSAESESRGPRGVPGKRQSNVSMQIKRAWKASGKRVSLKAFAKKHRPEQTATWKANKSGRNAR